MYRITEAGQAEAIPGKTLAELDALVERGVTLFGTMIGAVLWGGVQATPIRIEINETYETEAFLMHGKMIPAGTVVTLIDETYRPKP